MNRIELAVWINSKENLPQYIEVNYINEYQVNINGKYQNYINACGIVNQNRKWMYFETDDERGYLSHYRPFDTEEDACEYAQQQCMIKLKAYESEKHTVTVQCPSCSRKFPFFEKEIPIGEKYEVQCPKCNTLIVRKKQ
jgi:predicted Zn finger-like uncharacterized protein